MIKGSVQQENITFCGIYAPKKGAREYVKQNKNRHKEKNRQQYNDSRGVKYPTYING